MLNINQIKHKVKERYAARARQGSACCDPTTEALPNLYTADEMVGLPVETLAVSAGFGNPTALAGVKPGEVVLDLGSGGGIDCFLAARQVGDSGHVYGLDMTSEMIALARRNARTLGLTNVEFLQGGIEAIPLDDCSVDVIISNCVVCLSPDRDAVFGEAFRVLRPGGRLHLSDMATTGDLPDKVNRDPDRWVSCGGGEPIDTYVARVKKAGFVDVEVEQERPGEEGDSELSMFISAKVTARKSA